MEQRQRPGIRKCLPLAGIRNAHVNGATAALLATEATVDLVDALRAARLREQLERVERLRAAAAEQL